ncbi:MAG: HlyD family efflux transporter periplasmic adaptor subunit [Chloroflexi bacterium]|nr:HlyD family efflux transporter periplasmic adaptor subunit [Chloroflexota bacterium]
MNKKLFLIGLLLIVVVGVLVAFQPFAGEPETAVSQPVANVSAAQTAVSIVSAEGQITPLFFADLSFQTGGIVEEILVAEGDVVSVGDPLIQLDAADVAIGLQQAQARVASAEAGLVSAQNQLTLAQASIASAQANVTSAEANLALAQSGPVAAEIEQAENSLAAAQSGVTQAAGNRDAVLNATTNSQINAAEAALASATANLRALEDNYQAIIDACFETPNGDEVCPLYGPVEESTRAQLEIAQANQVAAQEALNALNVGPTAAQQQAANGGVSIALANRDVAQAQLDLLLAGATAEQIAIAEVQVQQAEVGVRSAEVGITQAEAAITQAEAAVTTAQASIEAAQAALDRMTLTATFDGTIARIDTTVGELVGSGVPVITMADLSAWVVKTTDLTELDVAQVSNGADVTIRIDAIPDETVSGTVTDVALVSSISRGDVVYEVTVQLGAAPDLPLRWGMTVFTDIGVK